MKNIRWGVLGAANARKLTIPANQRSASGRVVAIAARDRTGVEITAAECAGTVPGEAFIYRHHPVVEQALDLLASGAIGEPRLVRRTGWAIDALRAAARTASLP